MRMINLSIFLSYKRISVIVSNYKVTSSISSITLNQCKLLYTIQYFCKYLLIIISIQKGYYNIY